jgi:DNA-binding response OmpR family regulator
MAPHGEKPLIMIVENEEALREVLRLTLLPIGVDVVETSDLEEARARMKEDVDLVILDFYLEPEMGTDLLEDIPAGTPVLLLTASMEVKKLRQMHPTIGAVLRKPFDQRELRSTVKTLLGMPQE